MKLRTCMIRQSINEFGNAMFHITLTKKFSKYENNK
jgi:hypothetical protein